MSSRKEEWDSIDRSPLSPIGPSSQGPEDKVGIEHEMREIATGRRKSKKKKRGAKAKRGVEQLSRLRAECKPAEESAAGSTGDPNAVSAAAAFKPDRTEARDGIMRRSGVGALLAALDHQAERKALLTAVGQALPKEEPKEPLTIPLRFDAEPLNQAKEEAKEVPEGSSTEDELDDWSEEQFAAALAFGVAESKQLAIEAGSSHPQASSSAAPNEVLTEEAVTVPNSSHSIQHSLDSMQNSFDSIQNSLDSIQVLEDPLKQAAMHFQRNFDANVLKGPQAAAVMVQKRVAAAISPETDPITGLSEGQKRKLRAKVPLRDHTNIKFKRKNYPSVTPKRIWRFFVVFLR